MKRPQATRRVRAIGILAGAAAFGLAVWAHHTSVSRRVDALRDALGIQEAWRGGEPAVMFFRRTLRERFLNGDAESVRLAFGRAGIMARQEPGGATTYYVSLSALHAVDGNELYIYVRALPGGKVSR